MSVKETSVIDAEIKAIATAGAKLDQRIQACAVDVLVHFAQHKDTGLVNRLYLALSKGTRKVAMTGWLLQFCAVQANDNPKTKGEQPFVSAKNAEGKWTKVTDAVGGAAKPWYDFKPDPAPDEVFDLKKAVMSLIKKAANAETIQGGTLDHIRQIAELVGIPASDVPSKLATATKQEEEASA